MPRSSSQRSGRSEIGIKKLKLFVKLRGLAVFDMQTPLYAVAKKETGAKTREKTLIAIRNTCPFSTLEPRNLDLSNTQDERQRQ